MVEKLLVLQHRLNPLHVYCRFLDRGLNKRLSALLCRSYEILIFTRASWIARTVVHLFHYFDGGRGVREVVKGR
jgi:hypothetical protein